eukprot:gene17081-20302_t
MAEFCRDPRVGVAGWCEEACYVHRGMLKSWNDSKGIQRLRPQGWCSWCANETSHEAITVPSSIPTQMAGTTVSAGMILAGTAAVTVGTMNPVPAVVLGVVGLASLTAQWKMQCMECHQVTVLCTKFKGAAYSEESEADGAGAAVYGPQKAYARLGHLRCLGCQ